MTTFLSALAVAALAGGAAWLFGSFVLRWAGGIIAFLVTASIAISGDPTLLWSLIPAAAAWLLGHALYRARHGYYKSQLAQVALYRLPLSSHLLRRDLFASNAARRPRV